MFGGSFVSLYVQVLVSLGLKIGKLHANVG